MNEFELLSLQWENEILSPEDALLIVGGDVTQPKGNNCVCYGNNCSCGGRANNCNCEASTTGNNCQCGGTVSGNVGEMP